MLIRHLCKYRTLNVGANLFCRVKYCTRRTEPQPATLAQLHALRVHLRVLVPFEKGTALQHAQSSDCAVYIQSGTLEAKGNFERAATRKLNESGYGAYGTTGDGRMTAVIFERRRGLIRNGDRARHE